MKKAAEVASKGVDAAIAAVKPGVTEIEVAAEAEYAMRRAGAMRYGSSTFVDSGPHSIWLAWRNFKTQNRGRRPRRG